MSRNPSSTAAAYIVFLAGVSAALHIGKLPPALPALRDALGVSLLQAGFLLSLVQVAGMTLGLAVGLAADSLGLKRSTIAGLVILSVAGALGGWAQQPASLLWLRALEGFGFLLATLPAPSLMRRLVPPARLSIMLGVWSTYMPLGTALALLLGPLVIDAAGWRLWWWVIAAISLAMELALWRTLPPDAPRSRDPRGAASASRLPSWQQRLRQTLSSKGPWLVALSFAVYSGQWLAIIGFLPSIYAQAGLVGSLGGALTALVAASNIVGNLASGRALHRGVAPHALLWIGFTTMALGAVAAFADFGAGSLPLALRYAAVLLFSMVGGLIPGTLFSLAVKLAPGEDSVATTVGWMQQWSSFGQFAGPPLVAALAARVGGWQWTWVVTASCCAIGAVLAWRIGRALHARRTTATRQVPVD
jgi:MFS family permease